MTVRILYQKKLLLSFALMVHLFVARSAAPSLRCINVLSNGDVELTWEKPDLTACNSGSSSFQGYHIWSSTNGTSFTKLNTILDENTTSYVHMGANGNSGKIWYYVESECGDFGSTFFQSDTLQSIFLEVNNAADPDGYAHLEWNLVHDPVLPTSDVTFKIYRKYVSAAGVPITGWSLINSVSNIVDVYTDLNKICSDSIYYQIELADNLGCSSHSNEAGELIEDHLAPIPPILDSASVVGNGIQLSWTSDGSGDIGGYIIIRDNAIIDTVYGALNTSYFDPTTDHQNQSHEYVIAVFDTCWSGVPPSPNTSGSSAAHESIFLSTVKDTCDRSISLSWTPYLGWAGANQYQIFVAENGGNFKLLKTISGGSLNFIHTNLVNGISYSYLIRAIENSTSVTASSNVKVELMRTPIPPAFLYLTAVSVLDDNTVTVNGFADILAQTDHFIVERSDQIVGPFQQVGTITTISATGDISFVDNTVNADERSYYYRIIAVDICGNEVLISEVSKTIYLRGEADSERLQNNLTWDEYLNWDIANSGVDNYQLFRVIDGEISEQIYQHLPTEQFDFIDDVSALLNVKEGFCYYVEANEAPGNIYNFQEKSRSNTICLTPDPIIWTANAFSPNGDGINDVFRPNILFVTSESYSFVVYNRWGTQVFSTNSVAEFWDGKYGGNEHPVGVYVYQLQFENEEGFIEKRQGTITLVR